MDGLGSQHVPKLVAAPTETGDDAGRGPSDPAPARGQSQQEVLPAGTQPLSGPRAGAVQAPRPSSLLTSAEASTAVHCSAAPLSTRPPTPPPLTPQQEAWAASQPLSPSEACSRPSPAGSGLECWLAAWGALARDKDYFAWAKGSGLAGDVQEAGAQLPRPVDHSRKRGPTRGPEWEWGAGRTRRVCLEPSYSWQGSQGQHAAAALHATWIPGPCSLPPTGVPVQGRPPAADAACGAWGAAWDPATCSQLEAAGPAAAGGLERGALIPDLAWEADGLLAVLSGEAGPTCRPSCGADLPWSAPQPPVLDACFDATSEEEAADCAGDDWGLPPLDAGWRQPF